MKNFSTLDHLPSTIYPHPRLVTLDPRLVKLDPRLVTLDPRLVTLDPRPKGKLLSPTLTEVNNCFSIYHTSWITSRPKRNFICYNIPTKAILFFFGCSEVNSACLITSELANKRARKVLFTCVVFSKSNYNFVAMIHVSSTLALMASFHRFPTVFKPFGKHCWLSLKKKSRRTFKIC